jgi:hypothetical protein
VQAFHVRGAHQVAPVEPSRNKVTHETAQSPCSQTTKEAGTSSQAKSKDRPVPSQEKITEKNEKGVWALFRVYYP